MRRDLSAQSAMPPSGSVNCERSRAIHVISYGAETVVAAFTAAHRRICSSTMLFPSVKAGQTWQPTWSLLAVTAIVERVLTLYCRCVRDTRKELRANDD